MATDDTQRARSRRRFAVRGGLILLLLGIVFTGCTPSDSPRGRFDDYLTRLARTLERDLPPTDTTRYVGYPARRVLRRPIEVPRTGWIGFFQLHRCGLVNLVAQRNSVLGRVAPPQARLAYEARLLAGLEQCRTEIPADDTDNDFTERLDELIALKRSSLGATLWNKTWASASMAHLFSVAGGDAGLQPTLAGRASRRALSTLAGELAAITQGNPVSEAALASTYETLDKSEYGGALQIAANDAAKALERARAALETRLADRPLCFNKQPNRRSRILRTVLLDIYGQRVQPYLSDLVRAGRLWRAAVTDLVDAQPLTPATAFARYRSRTLAADSGVWARLDRAIETHTEAWQTALGQCDLMPGSSR